MPSELDLTLGPAEIGALLSCMLYGAVTVQLYTYSRQCQGDSRWLILFVVSIWFLETLFTILSICWLYGLTISNFGDPLKITGTPWTIDTCITLQGVVGAAVQSFFAYRVWKISKSLFWPSFAWAGAISRVAMNLSMSYFAAKSESVLVFSDKYGWEITTSLSVALAVDILNAAALSWYLSSMRSGFKQTTRMIDQVMIYSIETGLLTSIAAACMLITRETMPNNYVWLSFFQVYAKLYSNSLLVSLNARAKIKDKYLNQVTTVPTAVNPSSSIHWPMNPTINIQMASYTETGEPGQKQERIF